MKTKPSLASFEALGLSPQALEALARVGFEHPTPIQAGAIPPALAGKDVIGCAATGTGKSAAFALPMLDLLAQRPPGSRGLVLAPTRELALQIAEVIDTFGRTRRLRCVTIIGGMPMPAQVQALRAKPAVIVATPGRLVDHLNQGTAELGEIEILVLDEAERMLDMGFRPQLTRVLALLPHTRDAPVLGHHGPGGGAVRPRRAPARAGARAGGPQCNIALKLLPSNAFR